MSNKINEYNYAITNVEYNKNIITWVLIWEINQDNVSEKFFIKNPKRITRSVVIKHLNSKKLITTIHINNSNLIEYYMNGILLKNNGIFPSVIPEKHEGKIYIKTTKNNTPVDNLENLPNILINFKS